MILFCKQVQVLDIWHKLVCKFVSGCAQYASSHEIQWITYGSDHKDTVAVTMATGNNGSLFSRSPSFHSPVYTRNKIAMETEEWWRQNGGGLGTRQWCKPFTAHNTTFTDPLHISNLMKAISVASSPWCVRMYCGIFSPASFFLGALAMRFYSQWLHLPASERVVLPASQTMMFPAAMSQQQILTCEWEGCTPCLPDNNVPSRNVPTMNPILIVNISASTCHQAHVQSSWP